MLNVRPPTPGLIFDLGRWFLEEALRASLPPENPEILRFCAGSTWRLSTWLKPARRALMIDEVRRCFGLNVRTAETVVREAHDATLQARLEVLLAPQILDFSSYLRIFGEFPEGGLLLHPSVAAAPLLHAVLSRRYPGLVVFRARGLPPRGGQGSLRDSRINRISAKRRLKAEEQLPIVWECDPDAIEAHLGRGARVVAAFDDRAYRRWEQRPLLGRPALLSPDPWEAARRVGAPVIPAFILRERDKTSRATLGKPIAPSLESWMGSVEGWLRAHPSTYAMWLAECRIRQKMDDHPFFLDYGQE